MKAKNRLNHSSGTLASIAILAICAVLLAASTAFAQITTMKWTGAAGGNTMNTAGNWSPSGPPNAGNLGLWDGTVQTNNIYLLGGGVGPGSGNTGPSWEIGSGYTNSLTIAYTNGNIAISNLTVDAGAGPFMLASISTVAGNGSAVFRAASGTNYVINNSTNVAVIAGGAILGSGSGIGRTVVFGGSGSWVINCPWNVNSGGNGTLGIRVDGSNNNNTVTFNTNSDALGVSDHIGDVFIANGTAVIANGNALGATAAHTTYIDGVLGTKTLALTNNISLNAAVANINITGRNTTNMPGDAAILNQGGSSDVINGTVRFNSTGGTNISIYNPSGTLTLSGAVTCANVTGNRYFNFFGAGTNIIGGIISNGSAVANIVEQGGVLVLNNANTYTGNSIVNSGVLTLANNLAIPNSTALINGGILDVNGGNGYSPFVGGLAGVGVVDSLSGGLPTLSVGSNNVSSTFNGNITNSSGTLSLQKVGTGTFTLAGASGYSGSTTVAQGTLLVSNTLGSATGSGDVTVNAGAAFGGVGSVHGNVTWQSGSSAQFTLNPTTAVSGSNSTPLTVVGNITPNGNTVTVNLTGGTIAAGTYKLMSYGGASGSFASTPVLVPTQYGLATSVTTSGGQVLLTVSYAGVAAVWTNDVDGNWTTVADWSSNPVYPHNGGDAATLGVGSAFRTVTLNANATVGAMFFTNANSFQVADAGNTLTLDNSTVGAATILVSAGTSNQIGSALTLNTNLTIVTSAGTGLAFTNTVSGANKTISVSGPGTLTLTANNTYGPLAGTVGTTVGGGVLQLGKANAIGAGDLSVPSSSTIRVTAPMTLANNIIAGAGATATADDSGNTVTLSGVVSGAGALAKAGAGTMTINNVNSYNGDTTVGAGSVVLGNASGIPGGTGNGNVNMSSGTTLNLNGHSVVLNALNSSTNTAVVDTLSGGAVTLTLGESGASGTFAGSINNTAGPLTLVKDGAGTQTLSGTNNYTGGTTINAGTLQIGNGGTTGTLGSGTLLDNGNLAFNLTGTNIFSSQITGTGSVTTANTSLSLFLTGSNTFTGTVQNNGGVLWITNASALGVGPKSVNAQGNLNSSFTQLRLAGNVTIDPSITFNLSYSGGVLVNVSGTNEIQGSIGCPNGGGNPLILSSNGLLTLSGTISTVTGNNPRTVILGGPANGIITGNLTDSGLPALSLTKQDSGTWTIAGSANLYSQATTVNGGTLLYNGTSLGTSAVTVNTNATFGGTGIIEASANPAATWALGSKAKFFIPDQSASPGGSTPMTVYGGVTLNNNSVEVYVNGTTPLAPGTYTLLSEGNPAIYVISGLFASTPVITGAGVANGTRYFVTTTSSSVVLTVVNSSVWVHNANGNWTTGVDWDTNPNYPNAAGQTATLGVGSALTTVNLDASETIGGIYFTNNNSFVVTNESNVMTFDNNGNGAIISVSAGTANAIATGVSLTDGVGVTVTTTAGTALAINGNVNGSSALALSGGGAVTLAGSNAYTGNTTLNGGTLVLGSTNAVGSGTLKIAGGNVDSSTPNLIIANNNAQNWNGSFNFLGSQNLNLGFGSVALGNNLTLNVISNKLTVPGDISGSYTLTVSCTNNSILELDGNNSFSGLTFLSGTIELGSDTALGGAATLQFSPANITPAATNLTIMSKDSSTRTIANAISVNAFDGPYILGGTGDLVFNGNIVSGNGYKRFYVINKSTFNGLVTDNGAPSGPVAKDGPGTLILTANNTTTKPFQILAGTLALGSTTAIGSGALTINGGGLDSTVANLVNANNNAQTWAGNFYFVGSDSLNLGTGSVTMNTNITITVSSNTLTVGGAITGVGRSLAKAGTGTLVLAGANTYSNTTVTAGTLEIAQATLATNSTVAISNSAVLQLDFATTNQVAALVLGGVSQPAGVYQAANSGGRITGTGALLVVPLGPTGPASITSSVIGSSLSLSWPSGQGWKLQMQTNGLATGLSTNWIYITDGSINATNITIDPSKPTVFYRLTYP